MIEGHLFIATSVDGFIAREDDGLDWLEVAGSEEDHGFAAFMARMDGLVIGARTYRMVLGFGGDWPYAKPVVVMSRSGVEVPEALEGRVRVMAGTPREVMATLDAEGWERAYVDGGQLIQAFLRDGLIKEMVITQVPVLLGSGVRLFGETGGDVALEAVRAERFPSGLVQTRWRVPFVN